MVENSIEENSKKTNGDLIISIIIKIVKWKSRNVKKKKKKRKLRKLIYSKGVSNDGYRKTILKCKGIAAMTTLVVNGGMQKERRKYGKLFFIPSYFLEKFMT